MSAAIMIEDERPALHVNHAAARLGVNPNMLELMVREHNISGYTQPAPDHQHPVPGVYIYLDEIERLELAM